MAPGPSIFGGGGAGAYGTAARVAKSASSAKKRRDANRNSIRSKPTAYNKFIKAKWADLKAGNPEKDHSELKQMISDLWKEHKAQHGNNFSP